MLKKILWISIPVLLFLTVIYLFSIGLKRDQNQMPSALIDKPLPDFALSDLFDANTTYNKSVLLGEFALLNIWASWCPPCAAEHDVIMQLANEGMTVFGLNYQDNREQAINWLNERGNPYKHIFYDQAGSVGIDWGVIAVPETFLLDPEGIIRYRYMGELTMDIWHEQFVPIINQIKAQDTHVQ